jgi:predicted GIY-YIG superfamily endonuclease
MDVITGTEQLKIEKLTAGKPISATSQCKSTNCKTCPFVNRSLKIECAYTNNVYYFGTAKDFSCTDCNVIYCITCKKCNVHYIGETVQKVQQRFTQHRKNIRDNKTDSYLVKHFNQPDHSFDDITIRIIDHVSNHITDKSTIKALLKERETEWIKEMNTAYPYGLNDQVLKYGNISDVCYVNPLTKGNQPYFTAKKRVNKKRGKKKHKKRCPVIDTLFIDNVSTYLKNGKRRDLYVYLKSTNKKTLRDAINTMERCQIDSEISLIIAGFYAGFYDVHSNKKSIKQNKTIDHRNNDKISIVYNSQDISKINLQRILNSNKIQNNLINDNAQKRKVDVIYKYKMPISQSLCNHKQFLKTNSIQTLLQLAQSNCECMTTFKDFAHKDLKHVVTADVDVIKNLSCNTANLLTLGAKYRTNDKNVSHRDYVEIIETVSELVRNICIRNKLPNISYRIKKIKRILCLEIQRQVTISSDACAHKRIGLPNNVRSKFIITQVDKASNNFGISCINFYAKSVLEEINILPLNVSSINPTYKNTGQIMDNIVHRHEALCNKFGTKLPDNGQLPVLYGLPKLHKNPPKYRFIAAANNSTSKPFAQLLHQILTHCKDHFYNFCKVIESRTGKKMYISIENSEQVLQHIRCQRKKIESAAAYDFSTLYTKLPHHIVEKNLHQLVDKLFNTKGYTHIAIDTNNKFHRSHYCFPFSKKVENYTYFSKEDVKDLITTVIEETYVKVGDVILRQIAGIPQGGNASPLIADLTLSWLEYKYFISTNVYISRNTSIYRYIDDILAVNFDFDNISADIYPDSLILNKDSGTVDNLNYLDLCIKKGDIQFTVYNKLDVFQFEVYRAVHGKSCVHSRVITGTIMGQLYRFTRITSKFDDWINTTTKFVDQLLEREHEPATILHAVAKFCGRHGTLLYKYKLFSNKDIASKILLCLGKYIQSHHTRACST